MTGAEHPSGGDASVPGARPGRDGSPTSTRGIAHMVLRVADWRRAATWYQQVLGFERRKADGFTCLVHPDWNFILLLRPTGSPLDATSAPSQRLDHLALHVGSLVDLEAWRARLGTQGLETEIDHVSVGASITLHDPDGLEVELFSPSDGSPLSVRSPG